ncbi:MAG TPA: hypothetical protein VLK33_23060 [Terriglobales bacterium]|nr:hypothetical protein [Terriglobales bacterium]
MSIQQNPNHWGVEMPPSPTDALYWRDQLQVERRKFQHWPQRPNPELNENARHYWSHLWTENNDNDSQST